MITGRTCVVHNWDVIIISDVLKYLISLFGLKCVSHRIWDIIKILIRALLPRLGAFKVRCPFTKRKIEFSSLLIC